MLAAIGCSDDFSITPIYNHANGRVVVQMSRDIGSDESLFVRVRRGTFGPLDCAPLAADPKAAVTGSGS